jgi:NAD(P)-dependent dehydrogenase (short-subunit alcohol dehydrogenase family)/putative sterol carrier protein
VSEVRFDDQVAVITGAGGGLGRVFALELARRGARVVVNDLGGARDGTGESSGRPADKVVEEIKDLGGEAVANYDSVATPQGGQSIIDQAVKAFGRIDILINNAGILRDRTLAKMNPEDWEQVMAVHLHGAYQVTRPALLIMREQGFGRIVMMTSGTGLFGNFGQTNYGAAKMGLVGMMNTMKLEGEKYDVRVNAVAPMALTRLTEDILPPDLADRLKPEYVAPLVLYLCSRSCEATGMVFNAGLGYFNRAALLAGPGTAVGAGESMPTVEDIHKNWEAINRMENPQGFRDAMASVMPMVEAVSPQEGKGASAAPQASEGPGVAGIFERMPDAFQADRAAGVDVVFQYSISGPKGGDWYVVIKDSTCTVQSGKHDAPTTTIRISDDDFLALIAGKLNAMQAYTSGKLKIEGDLMKSQLIEKLFKF